MAVLMLRCIVARDVLALLLALGCCVRNFGGVGLNGRRLRAGRRLHRLIVVRSWASTMQVCCRQGLAEDFVNNCPWYHFLAGITVLLSDQLGRHSMPL